MKVCWGLYFRHMLSNLVVGFSTYRSPLRPSACWYVQFSVLWPSALCEQSFAIDSIEILTLDRLLCVVSVSVFTKTFAPLPATYWEFLTAIHLSIRPSSGHITPGLREKKLSLRSHGIVDTSHKFFGGSRVHGSGNRSRSRSYVSKAGVTGNLSRYVPTTIFRHSQEFWFSWTSRSQQDGRV